MPADLKVVKVRLPPVLRAPCPVVVRVYVENQGTDQADPGDYDVTIDVRAGERPDAHFETIVTDVESQRLAPGRVIEVLVELTLPCLSPISLTATVDKKQQILNNLRSAPSLTRAGLIPTLVPWLAVALRVGISDAAGLVTWDPDEFCPGKTVVAEVVVRNEGCIASMPSRTEVSLEDANAVPVPVSLTSASYPVPPLAPGGSHRQLVSFLAPSSAAGLSGALGVRVGADVDRDNPDQCDRSRLVAMLATPFSGSGGPPQLTFTVQGGGVIRPGEAPTPGWSIRNECSEIGLADVRILFGNPPTELYKISYTIPLRTTVEQQFRGPLSIPPTIANAFWTLGLKSLELEVTGDGSDPGPYRATAPLNVIPEPIDDTWWTWAPTTPAFWKSSYGVGGTFTNNGLAGMTVSTLSTVEHPTDVPGTSQDQTLTPPSTVFGATIPPGGTVTAAWVRRQSWTWLLPVTFVEVGPQSRTFTYTANFSVTDAFGNSYPTIPSLPTSVAVTVSGGKIVSWVTGTLYMNLALGAFAAAVVAAVTVPYPAGAIIAGVMATFGLIMFALAMWALRVANDPPVPDFREQEPPLSDPRTWKIPEVDDESLEPLRTFTLLLARVASACLRATRYRDQAWAAYVDCSESTRIRHRDAARDELETLRRLVTPVTNAADEAEEKFGQLLDDVRELPSPGKLREMVAGWAEELQLNEVERSLVDRRLEAVEDEEELRRAVEQARSDGLRTAADIVRRLYEATASEFAEAEYLR